MPASSSAAVYGAVAEGLGQELEPDAAHLLLLAAKTALEASGDLAAARESGLKQALRQALARAPAQGQAAAVATALELIL